MASTLNWGIIGSGNIAGAFASHLPKSKTGKLLAVGSRSQQKADEFGKQFKVPRCYGSYEAMLADPDVQAVYIATPHPDHLTWVLKTAAAKKHILCEKPIGLNWAEAQVMIEAARQHDVFLMEAFMYRCHPQTKKLVELIAQKVIGDVKLIQAAFGFHSAFSPENRLWKNSLGGGGILDVGCYPVSFSRLIAGLQDRRPFLNPSRVTGAGFLHPNSGTDAYAAAVLEFDNGVIAQVATSVGVEQENVARIYGTEGWIFLPTPWVPARDGGIAKIIVHKPDQPPHEISWEVTEPIYALEADTVAEFVEQRQAGSPAMSWEDTLGNLKTLDQWRQAIGLTYDAEKWESLPTYHHRPLAVLPRNTMQYQRIGGIDKDISRLIVGVDNHTFAPYAAVVWESFFEHGGNAFDTAYVYGAGACETALGAWMKTRGLREQMVILSKGAHTPECDPASITRQHQISLDRLQTGYVDLYFMHRDNPAVPVGEFVDVLNEHLKAGSIKAIGASNWSLARVEAFNDWAAKQGKIGFAAISNQLSLAKMVDAPWPGSLSANDAAHLEFHTRTQLPLLPWSSQGRGFFVEASPNLKTNAELVRCWYSDDNFERLRRARELAKNKGVAPIQIALAWVLHQPFPTFPLIGPRTLSETATSVQAMEVILTPQERMWLDLHRDGRQP